jgi:hypothetical protein
MFQSEVRSGFGLDSRYKHAGMTDSEGFGNNSLHSKLRETKAAGSTRYLSRIPQSNQKCGSEVESWSSEGVRL